MKNLLLLGDSIRMGYDSFVQEKLQGRANVYYSPENGRFAQFTLRELSYWKEVGSWPGMEMDVVHWNNGAWDCMHLNACRGGCPPEEAGELIVPEGLSGRYYFDKDPVCPQEMYRYMLGRVATRIHQLFPKARIVFATTTQVIESMAVGAYRSNADIEEYNCIAREVLTPRGIRINELGDFAYRHCRDMHPEGDWVHYTDQGYELLAGEVVAFLEKEKLI